MNFEFKTLLDNVRYPLYTNYSDTNNDEDKLSNEIVEYLPFDITNVNHSPSSFSTSSSSSSSSANNSSSTSQQTDSNELFRRVSPSHLGSHLSSPRILSPANNIDHKNYLGSKSQVIYYTEAKRYLTKEYSGFITPESSDFGKKTFSTKLTEAIVTNNLISNNKKMNSNCHNLTNWREELNKKNNYKQQLKKHVYKSFKSLPCFSRFFLIILFHKF